jgi:hypothetical protein
MGGFRTGDLQCRVLLRPRRLLIRLLHESGALQPSREGKLTGSLTAAGLAVGGEQNSLRAARRRPCPTMAAMGGRQLSILSMGRGVERKQFVTHLCTEAQKTSMWRSCPGAGT